MNAARRALAAILLLFPARAQSPPAPVAPPPANLAAFGRFQLESSPTSPPSADLARRLADPTNTVMLPLPAGQALVLDWDHPRPVRTVILRTPGAAPEADAVRLEWWRRVWPDNGTGGWMKLDDPFHGQWTPVRATPQRAGDRLRLDFAPLTADEAPGVTQRDRPERLTYRLRLVPRQPLSLLGLEVHSDAVLRHATLRFEWTLPLGTDAAQLAPCDVRNGRLLTRHTPSPRVAIVDVEYADAPDRLSPDRGHVVVRDAGLRGFAVFVDDVLREGGLYVRDLGVFVSDLRRGWTHATWPGPGSEVWPDGTVVARVGRQPEQTLARLVASLPPKPSPYLWLGVPDHRQEIGLLPQGEILLRADSLRSPGPDRDLRPWTWETLVYDFAGGAHPILGPKRPRTVDRQLADGWLPILQHTWEEAGIRYGQTSAAAPLLGGFASLTHNLGTETVVLANRFELHNPGETPATAWLWLELNHPLPLRVAVDGTLVLDKPSDGQARPHLVPVRGRFETFGRGTLDVAVLEPAAPGSHHPAWAATAKARPAVRYQVDLAPHETHAVEFFVPYVELLDVTEMAALKSITFTNVAADVRTFWQTRVHQGMTYEVPEPLLNDFFKANLWHVLISTDPDPVTGHHQHGAATHDYRNFLNETVMVAQSLEMRGEPLAAARLLEPFLASQSAKGLPGNFKSSHGVLYAAQAGEPDPYTAQGYNMHHGWGLAGLAEHYLWTRDGPGFIAMLPRLLLAADWIGRERQATRQLRPDGTRPIEFGLAPAGDLEDVEEFLYYYATSGYYHLGIRRLAQALTAASRATRQSAPGTPLPPEQAVIANELQNAAAQVAREADAFRQDLRASLAESVTTSPVVRLRDGLYVPWVPPRVHALTHRKEGWIREALYPALHLVPTEVLEPGHPYVAWMIEDLEDNVFLSAESGYGLQDPAAEYFDRGGFTLQPNLLDLALVYLARDQIPHFLRAFYNTLAVSLYPAERCFTEWVPALGQGGGPLYKTPDECKFIQWMRRMLIEERGEGLELGLGVPRAWMTQGQRVRVRRAATWYGRLDLELDSQVDQHRISAIVRLAPTVLPATVRLRLRHPEGRPLVNALVNERPAKINSDRQLIELVLPSHPSSAKAAPSSRPPLEWRVVGTF